MYNKFRWRIFSNLFINLFFLVILILNSLLTIILLLNFMLWLFSLKQVYNIHIHIFIHKNFDNKVFSALFTLFGCAEAASFTLASRLTCSPPGSQRLLEGVLFPTCIIDMAWTSYKKLQFQLQFKWKIYISAYSYHSIFEIKCVHLESTKAKRE